MTTRTELSFLVVQTRAGWVVQADGFAYPPCTDFAGAFACAVGEAKAAGDLGFASAVLAQTAAGHPCSVRWTYDDGDARHAGAGTDEATPTPRVLSDAARSNTQSVRAGAPALPLPRSGPETAVYDYAIDERTRSWMVVHLASGDVARLNGVPQQDLTIDAADGMAALMNRIAYREPVAQEG
ncbi:hypothetical protein [Azospirillum sp. ST 5-10]|uniref:hypothetical protein n=1 Tax=unclassified Azospirillum TaxID=2630922 RepID=UPI003F49DBD0